MYKPLKLALPMESNLLSSREFTLHDSRKTNQEGTGTGE